MVTVGVCCIGHFPLRARLCVHATGSGHGRPGLLLLAALQLASLTAPPPPTAQTPLFQPSPNSSSACCVRTPRTAPNLPALGPARAPAPVPPPLPLRTHPPIHPPNPPPLLPASAPAPPLPRPAPPGPLTTPAARLAARLCPPPHPVRPPPLAGARRCVLGQRQQGRAGPPPEAPGLPGAGGALGAHHRRAGAAGAAAGAGAWAGRGGAERSGLCGMRGMRAGWVRRVLRVAAGVGRGRPGSRRTPKEGWLEGGWAVGDRGAPAAACPCSVCAWCVWHVPLRKGARMRTGCVVACACSCRRRGAVLCLGAISPWLNLKGCGGRWAAWACAVRTAPLLDCRVQT